MGQPVVHWELWSESPQRLSAFYADVFGWQIRTVPEINYTLVETGGQGGINGGIMTPQKGPWPGSMTFYIDVDDIGTYADKIRQAGGKMIVERVDVPGVGAFALFADPDGRVLGLWHQQRTSGG
jgi:predicted enzyme related to lactoylglutathione lyase